MTGPTIDASTAAAAAGLLAEHRIHRRPLAEIPAGIRPATVADGYAVQDALVERLVGHHGGKRIGWKAACTNDIAQRALGVDGPMFGQLLSASTQHSPATLLADEFTTRVIECEFAVRIGADVPDTNVPYTADSIAEFVDQLMPAIEVVDHRYPDWSLGAPSIAADNAIHGAWVLGAPFSADWRTIDLPAHRVEARIDGELVSVGNGAAVLGHPLNVVAWLANELPGHGHQLRAGDLISTGVCTDIFSADAGSTVLADFGAIGTVSLRWR